MMVRWWQSVVIVGVIISLVDGGLSEARQTRQRSTSRHIAPSVSFAQQQLPTLQPCESAVLADATTGQILFAHNGNNPWPLASLTKMMTGLLTLEAIQNGDLSFQTPATISRRASQAGGRTINLRPGQAFSIEDLLRAMLVTSANDASVAVAERLCGSVQSCVQNMNRRAQQLGMTATRYQTVNGMPPGQGVQPDMSSATDMITLTRALLKHSHVLAWTALERAPFNNGRTMLANTNRLVGKIAGVDGLKTGFTRKARFNLVTTAERSSLRLIAIVLGAHNSTARFQTATTLLEWGFANFTRMRLIKSGDPLGIEVPVQNGDITKLRPIVAADAIPLVRKREVENLQLSFRLPPVVPAPIARHEILGELVVRDSENILAVILVVSPHEVTRVHRPPVQ